MINYITDDYIYSNYGDMIRRSREETQEEYNDLMEFLSNKSYPSYYEFLEDQNKKRGRFWWLHAEV